MTLHSETALPIPLSPRPTTLCGFHLADLTETRPDTDDTFRAVLMLDGAQVGAACNGGQGGPDQLHLCRGAAPRWLDILPTVFRQHAVPLWQLPFYGDDLALLFLRELARLDLLSLQGRVYRVRPEFDGMNALSLLSGVLHVYPPGAPVRADLDQRFEAGRGWVEA